MTEMKKMNGDIGRIRETIQHLFAHLLEKPVDQDVKSGCISYINWMSELSGPQNQEIGHMIDCIARLQETVCYLVRAIICSVVVEPEAQLLYIYSHINWTNCGVMTDDYLLEPEPKQETISQAEVIDRMKDDVSRLQDTLYQMLGAEFDQSTEIECIYEYFNWMKYGKVYKKNWLFGEDGEECLFGEDGEWPCIGKPSDEEDHDDAFGFL